MWKHLKGVDEEVYKDHMLFHCRTMAKLVTILPGSDLSVSRIYIRKGAEGHSSVTLYGKVFLDPDDEPIICRFWVCLDDWNTLNAQVI